MLRKKRDISFKRPIQEGLKLWLDASDTSTITSSGGLVSQWNDKSGNNNHAIQGTGAAQPGTGTVKQGGKNVITFDGTADFIQTGAFPIELEQPNTIIIVGK